MAISLTRNAIDGLVSNNTNPNETYVIQLLGTPTPFAENIFKAHVSDGYFKSKKGYLVGEAAEHVGKLKEFQVIKAKKYVEQHDKERIVISHFEIICDNVTEILGNPVDYKNFKNVTVPEASVMIPAKYLGRNAALAQSTVPKAANPINKPPVQQQQYNPPVAQNYSNNYNNNNNNNNNNFNNNNNNQNSSYKPSGQQIANRVNQNPQAISKQGSNLNQASSEDEKDLMQISDLRPNIEHLKFKARVTKKGEIKTFKTDKNPNGTLFSIDVIDGSGDEMSISFFGNEVQKFHNYIQPEQIYIFKDGQIKVNTNKQYNKGEYVMTANRDTIIVVANEDNSIPFFVMKHHLISDVQNLQKDTRLDLIAVVKNNSESKMLHIKESNRSKRDIRIYDQSRCEIEVSLWGDIAESLNPKKDDIIVIKDARITEYREKNQVSVGFGTSVFLNPSESKFEGVLQLKQWMNTVNKEQLMSELDAQNPVDNFNQAGNIPVNSYETSIAQLQDEIETAKSNGLIDEKFKIWKEIRALVLFVKETPLYYDSCITCKRKVIQDKEQWYCTICQVHYNEPKSRFIASLRIGDCSGQIWVSVFDEVATQILNYTADDFRQIGDNTDEKRRRLAAAQNKEFRFLLLSKAEKDPNTGLFHQKTVIQSIKDNNVAYESKRILKSLEYYIEYHQKDQNNM